MHHIVMKIRKLAYSWEKLPFSQSIFYKELPKKLIFSKNLVSVKYYTLINNLLYLFQKIRALSCVFILVFVK